MARKERISRREFLRYSGGVLTVAALTGCGSGGGDGEILTPTAAVRVGGKTATTGIAATPTAERAATAIAAPPTRAATSAGTLGTGALVDRIRHMARPLKDSDDLDPLLERVGNAHYVLLGEASHGTSEYYTWRARITQRLIREKGFSFVAVEGEWQDCYKIDQYVKARKGAGKSAGEVLNTYDRWPSWMWANREIEELVEWLRRHNGVLPEDQKAGFYGLDVYGLWDSAEAVLRYLERTDPSAAPVARQVHACFRPYAENEEEYAGASESGPSACRKQADALLRHLRVNADRYRRADPEDFFATEQSALVVKNAESYYRSAQESASTSWNRRDTHMANTLDRLMQHHGPGAKGIVWAHNTHVGDARATDMAPAGMVNIGQLIRQRHRPEDVVLVGFGSHQGTVIAAAQWGMQAQKMRVPQAREGSYEHAFHAAGAEDKLLIFSDSADLDPFLVRLGHRAIGVVYDPQYESYGNYVPTVLAERYDAFLYIDQTEALHPLHPERRARTQGTRIILTGV